MNFIKNMSQFLWSIPMAYVISYGSIYFDFYMLTCSFLVIDAMMALIGIINIITPTPANTDGPMVMYRNKMANTN